MVNKLIKKVVHDVVNQVVNESESRWLSWKPGSRCDNLKRLSFIKALQRLLVSTSVQMAMSWGSGNPENHSCLHFASSGA